MLVAERICSVLYRGYFPNSLRLQFSALLKVCVSILISQRITAMLPQDVTHTLLASEQLLLNKINPHISTKSFSSRRENALQIFLANPCQSKQKLMAEVAAEKDFSTALKRIFHHRPVVFLSYWSLAVAMPHPNLEGGGAAEEAEICLFFLQTFLSADYSLKPIIFLFKTSCLRHSMSLSHGSLIAEMLLIWMREKITTQSFKSRSQKHFMPRPIFSAPRHFAQKYFDHSEGGGGRVKINRR